MPEQVLVDCGNVPSIATDGSLETLVEPKLPGKGGVSQQVCGHAGTITYTPSGKSLLKKCCKPAKGHDESNEVVVYKKLMKDALASCVPRFLGVKEKDGEKYLELGNLNDRFEKPSVLDIKLGTRTFLECEASNSKTRNDLYEKMIGVDPNEPTADERAQKAITKLRYMQFREKQSSSCKLGFRIDAMKNNAGEVKNNFKKVKSHCQVSSVLEEFLAGAPKGHAAKLESRLRDIEKLLAKSSVFSSHEVIGSSILILYDDLKIGAWLIDFEKTMEIPSKISVDHVSSWQVGNHEDGYLFGLQNLTQIISNLGEGCNENLCSQRNYA